MNATHDPTALDARQLITFTLNDVEFGIDIMAIQELTGWSPATAIPNSPHWIRGLINLRGAIVPIIDLRARFGMPATEPTRTHVVIIVQAVGRMIGLLVDAVSDIISVSPDDLRRVPDFGIEGSDRLFSGLVARGAGMVAIVNLDAVMTLPDEVLQQSVDASQTL